MWWPTEKFPYACNGEDCDKHLTDSEGRCGAQAVDRYFCKDCYPKHFPCNLCREIEEEKK